MKMRWLLALLLLAVGSAQAAYRSGSLVEGQNSGTSFSATKPTGTAENDAIICTFVSTDQINISSTGFTTSRIERTADVVVTLTVMYKVAGASEPASYTVTSDFSANHRWSCSAFTGRDTGAPVTTVQSTALGSLVSSPISVALTGVTAATGDDIFTFAAVYPNDGSNRWAVWTAPTLYTEAVESAGSAGSFEVAYREAVSAGATGTLTAIAAQTTGTDTGSPGGFVLRLKAAPTDSNAPRAMHYNRMRH